MDKSENPSEEQPSRWPDDVRPISIDEMDKFGVSDKTGLIYWNGKAIHIQKTFTLSGFQTFLASGAAVSAIIMAMIEVYKVYTGQP